MIKEEKTSSTGRTICTRSLAASTLASVEPGLRRSNRGTPKQPLTPASSTRKSERLTPSPSSQRSNKGKKVLAQDAKGSDKAVKRIADTSPESGQRKRIRKTDIEELTDKNHKNKKREPVMSARSYRALLFRGKRNQSEEIVHASSKDEELVVVSCSRRVPAASDVSNPESKRLPVGETSLEKGTDVPLELIKDTETMVLDASHIVETMDDSVIGPPPSETSVGKTSLEKDTDVPLELIKETETTVLDASPIVETGDEGVICSPSETSVDGTSLEKDTDVPLELVKDTETTVLDASPIVETGGESVIGSPSETSVDGTSLEKGTDVPLELIKDTETMVLDASPIVETMDDSVIGPPSETLVGETSSEKGTDVPLKLIKDTETLVLDASPIVETGDDSVLGSPSETSSGCKNSNQSETSSTCEKRQKVNGDLESVSTCIAKPIQESGHAAQDMKEPGPVTSRDFGEKQNNMPQDKSHDQKLHLSMYPEFWIPVQLSDVQLEQYCRTLFCKAQSLSLPDLEETLTSVRKTCDHPYVIDASLKQLLMKNLEVHEILDVEVKASGKFHLLEAMLNQIKKNGLKAVVFYEANLSTRGILLGNMLEDFVCQKFGQQSYEHGICTSKKNAIKNFNKESQCFVLLLEKRACSQSIKLLRAEAFILFGSSLNPQHDIKHVGKIKIESYSEKTKIFRLYSPCTVEERALILARQNKPIENLSRPLIHELLMWGASYLFDKLDHFHGSETLDLGVPAEKSIMDGVISEFSSILSSKGGEENEGKLCLLLEAKHAHGTYRTDSTLFGEEHAKLSDEDRPNIFWRKLLEGKNPMWKYHSDTPQRNRKRVQYFQGSEESDKISNGGNTKKRKKAPDDVTDPRVTDSPVDTDERKTSGTDRMGALESPKIVALQPPGRSASGANGTSKENDVLGGHISGIPEDMLAGKDWRHIPCESQRSLQAVLKLDMAKLGKVLNFTEDWTSVAQKFLEYVIENHHICEEPATTLQAFQMALSWIAASLVKHKLNREESLVRAKHELAFSCSREEVDYIYAMLYCMKSLFLESTQGLQVDFVSLKEVNESLPGTEECVAEKRGIHYGSTTKDINKTISDIKKKCKKKEQKLVQMHEEKKLELLNRFADKKRELETKKKLEAAIIRITCSRISTQSLGYDLKQLDHDYARESDVITREKDECLKSLEEMHDAAKKKLAEDHTCWISRIEKWAQAELKKCVPMKSGNNKHFSGICSSNTSKNAHDVQTCNDVIGEATCPDTNCMVPKGNQEPESENTLETMLASTRDKVMDISNWSREQPAEIRGSTEFDHDDQDICHMPSSSVEKQPDPASNIQGQNIEAQLEPQPTRSEILETGGFGASGQDDQDICQMPSSSAEKQPDSASNIQGQDIEAAIEPQPTGSEIVETGGFVATGQGDQDRCPLPSSPAGNQPNSAAINEGQNIERSAEPHIAGGPDGGEIDDTAVSDQDTCSLPSALVGAQFDKAANLECQNTTTVAQLHRAESDSVETGGSALSDKNVQDASILPCSSPANLPDAAVNTELHNSTTVTEPHTTESDASPLPFSPPESHPDAVVSGEELNNTTVAEPHTIGSNASDMETAEHGPQVEQSTFANNLVHESVVVPSAAVTAPVPSLVNNSTTQSTAQPVPHIPFPVYNDPFQHELEKLRRESEQTKKAYEEKKSILKAELERKIAEAQAEFQRKVNEVEAEHNARAMENEKIKNRVIMNKLLANAFLCKCNDKNVSNPSAIRGRIQQLALRTAQVTAAPAPAPAQTPLQPRASSSVPTQSCVPLRSMPQPRQPLISNTTPSPSASLATNPVVHARLPHLNRSSSSVPNATATTLNSTTPPPLSAVFVQNQQQQQRQQNSVSGLQHGNIDVVYLSEDE